jgi:DNA-3-methyladenine glycosylase
MSEAEAQQTYGSPLPRSFYDRDPVTVARALLNCVLVRVLPEGVVVAGRISETEAYAQTDPSSHSFGGKKTRNAPMFGPPGHAYLYYIYGAHYCLNAVTGVEGVGEAVLIRALEPLAGLEPMRLRRGLTEAETRPSNQATAERTRNEAAAERTRLRELQALCGGPGRLCQAFGLDRAFNGLDLTLGCQVWVAPPTALVLANDILATPRIGISRAQDYLWRFTLRGDPFTSRGLTK